MKYLFINVKFDLIQINTTILAKSIDGVKYIKNYYSKILMESYESVHLTSILMTLINQPNINQFCSFFFGLTLQ